MTEETPSMDENPYEEARMTILDHLRELRVRVIYVFIAVFVGFIISWIFREQLFDFLQRPLAHTSVDTELTQMHHKDLSEPFVVMLKTSIFGGVFLASPFILAQLWLFIAPALYPDEKKFAFPFIFFATFFFVAGASFCFFLVMPYGFDFLLKFTDGSTPELMMKEYLSLVTKLLLGFGFVFELPVITAFLAKMGIITHVHLIRFWRYAIVIAFIVAAMLTPPDVITQTMMAGPLILLYTISIGVAYVISKGKSERKESKLQSEL